MHLCQMEWLPNDVTNKWFFLHKASAPLHSKEFYTDEVEFNSPLLLIILIFTKLFHLKSGVRQTQTADLQIGR